MVVGRRPSSSPRGPRRGWLSVLQQDRRCPPEQAVALGLAEGGGDRGGKIEALAQVSQFGMWCLSFQGPAMRAPRDATEGSGVSAGKEDSGMVPLGDAATRAEELATGDAQAARPYKQEPGSPPPAPPAPGPPAFLAAPGAASCPECGKASLKPAHLLRHRQSHSGQACGRSPAGSAARASGAASTCCATSASTAARRAALAGRRPRAPRAGGPSRLGR